MISLFMQGGPSHVDLFDPKPELDQLNGEKFTRRNQVRQRRPGQLEVVGQPLEVPASTANAAWSCRELLPGLGEVADDICLVRSMHTGVNNHGQSIFALNSGRITCRPAGTRELADLRPRHREPAICRPTVVLTDPGGLPVEGVHNWSNGWLPSLYQGTVIRPREPRILNLDPPPYMTAVAQSRYLSFLDRMNRAHLEPHPGELDLDARIASYELAAQDANGRQRGGRHIAARARPRGSCMASTTRSPPSSAHAA